MSTNFKNLYTSNNPPLQATLMRGSNIESIHKIHAVITDKKGRVLMCAGNPEYKSFIRSALKPFQAIPFVSSGAASKINNESKSIPVYFLTISFMEILNQGLEKSISLF